MAGTGDTQLTNEHFCWNKWHLTISFPFIARQTYSPKLLQPQERFGLLWVPTAMRVQWHSGALGLPVLGAAKTLPTAVSLLIAQTS